MYNDNMVLNATNSNNNHKSLIQITPEKLTISCLDNSDASMVFDDGHIGVDVPLTSSSSTASNPGQSEFITKAYADATYSGGGGGGVTYAEMVRYVDSVMLVSKQPIYVGFPSAVMLSLHDSGNLAIHNCSFDDQQGWTIDAGKVMFSDRDFTNSFCDCACVTLHDGDAYLLAYIFDRKTLARDIVLINCTTKKIEGCWDGYPMFQITQPVSLDNTLVFYTYGGNSGGTGGGLVVRHTFDTVTKEHTRMVYETGDGSIVNFMQTYDGYLFLNIVNTENTQYDGFYRVSVSDFTSNERIRKSLSITYQDAVTPLPEPTNSHIIKTKDLSYVLWEMSLESPQPTINWTLVSDILPGTTCTEYQHDKLSNDGNTAILGGDLDQRGFVFAYNIGSSNVNFYVTERTNAITQKTAINHYNINVIPYVVRGFETTWWENSPAAYLDYSLWGIGFSFWRRMSNLMLTLFSKGGTILWPPLSIEEIVQGSN
jgi:hypothetical protein